jgi:hypothetical protein
MVSLEIMMPESQSVAPQTKLELFRESTGPSVLARRLNKGSKGSFEETEGTSTTDTDGSETKSDALSDAALDIDEAGAGGDEVLFRSPDPFDCMPATACPFDYMPSNKVRAAFSEKNVAETWPAEFQNPTYSAPAPVMQPMAPPEPQPMQMPQMQMPQMQMPTMQMAPMQSMVQPMPMPAMQQMQQMQQQMQMAAPAAPQYATNPSTGQIMVPVPVPVPVQMPFSMPNFAPKSVPVPPGFKLVRIPGQQPEATEEKTVPAAKSAISNPASTERKIFVGGLNPSTTGQTLREYFATFGQVTDAKVIRDGEKSKGFGFVQFKDNIPAEVLEQAHIIDQRRCGVGPAFHRESAQEEVVA